jgi:DoxX-like protein
MDADIGRRADAQRGSVGKEVDPVFAAYITSTGLATIACAYAVYLNVTHASFVIDTAHRLGIPASLMIPFGLLLGLAAAGLLAGFAIPVLGTAAAAGLVSYFVIAVGAHLRANDRRLAWPLLYLSLASAALATGLAHHGPLG